MLSIKVLLLKQCLWRRLPDFCSRQFAARKICPSLPCCQPVIRFVGFYGFTQNPQYAFYVYQNIKKTLLEAFWPDLFLLAAFQFSSDCSMIPTATNENGCSGGSLGGEEESKLEVQHQQKPTTTGCALLDCPTTVRLIPEDLVSGLRALLQRFRQACPDSAELACLRALTLFQSGLSSRASFL